MDCNYTGTVHDRNEQVQKNALAMYIFLVVMFNDYRESFYFVMLFVSISYILVTQFCRTHDAIHPQCQDPVF